MQTEFVTMVHPNLPGQLYKAPKQAVGVLARSGWELAPEPPPPPPPAPKKTSEAPAEYGASSLEDTGKPPRARRAPKEEGSI